MKKWRCNFSDTRTVYNSVIRKFLFIASTIAGRNLEIIFAGASEPPGQLMKAQIPGLQSQDSDSVGLGWPCRSDFLVNFQSM